VANEQHSALLQKDVSAWNRWKALNPAILANLTSANLAGANLTSANLAGANLTFANLAGADLTYTNLAGADLTYADLTGAGLTYADLAGANLTIANLTSADLSYANLSGAKLINATVIDANLGAVTLFETVLGNLDFSTTSGLDRCHHEGPSIVDSRTLLKSGASLPLHFLRGCGLSDRLIDYLPSLLEAGPIQFYSCFLSYSTANQDFADRLYADLQNRGVRCWFAPHDMQPGRKIHDQIDEAIRVYDRLLLILSPESMRSSWVSTEISRARQKEIAGRNVLFPVALVPFEMVRAWQQFDAEIGDDSAKRIREYFVPDFSDWKNHDAYQQSFERLLKALKSQD
jgi:uncharacterized protein YjbI with pentapeptide repeats